MEVLFRKPKSRAPAKTHLMLFAGEEAESSQAEDVAASPHRRARGRRQCRSWAVHSSGVLSFAKPSFSRGMGMISFNRMIKACTEYWNSHQQATKFAAARMSLFEQLILVLWRTLSLKCTVLMDVFKVLLTLTGRINWRNGTCYVLGNLIYKQKNELQMHKLHIVGRYKSSCTSEIKRSFLSGISKA